MNYPTQAEFDAYPAHGGRTPRQRLTASYVIEATGCWRWTKALTTVGYGHFHYAGRYYQAHRLMYGLVKGPTKAATIDHLCRNRWCVNPAHLEPVTHRENIRRGQGTRLNPERIALIYELADRGFSQRAIGRLLTIDHSTVCRVLKGERWSEYAPKKEAA